MENQSSEERFMDGNYRMIRRLGSGGDGIVYLVEHVPTEQLRAAKRIEGSRAGERVNELNMMKHLHHPSLPQIIDILECAGQTWLVMEYIRGVALSESDYRTVTAEQFFRISLQLAEAVRYLHTRPVPILHLDIKPTNVLMCSDGRLVLIDFGAAVFLKRKGAIHRCIGTPGFAAPEQYGNGCVDMYTDVYAFGATLYFYLYRHIYRNASSEKVRSDEGKYQRRRGFRDRKKDTERTCFYSRESWWKRQAASFLIHCLNEKGELRFQSGRELEVAVRRLQKKYLRRKKLRSVWYASVLLAVAVVFFAGTVKPDMEVYRKKERETYERLLEKASGMGLLQAQECYHKAAALSPQDKRWYVQLLSQIESDYLFEVREERLLQELLYAPLPEGSTVLEKLKRNPQDYGILAHRIGIDYWYYYESAGAKSAASQWFDEAVSFLKYDASNAEDTEVLFKSAQIYSGIASYYEKLGRQDAEGKRHEDFYRYWKDLKKLWRLQGGGHEMTVIRRQIAEEILSVLTVKASQLYEAGERRSEIEEIIKEVEIFLKEEVMSAEEKKQKGEVWRGAGQYDAACAAVERVFSDERGNTIEESRKKIREKGKEESTDK